MGIEKIKGLVLREASSGEADKIITVLAKQRGKIVISAKGAKNSKSAFLAGTQQFCYSDFIIYDSNKSIVNLNQAELIEPFRNITKDLSKLCYGTYFMELLENVTVECVNYDELLQLSLRTLHTLNGCKLNLELIVRAYELRLMKIVGYMPETTKCVKCGKPVDKNIFFDAMLGGLLCDKCKTSNSKFISIGTLYSIQYILFCELPKLFRFSTSDKVLNELHSVTKAYISAHIDHRFKSLEFLEQLNL